MNGATPGQETPLTPILQAAEWLAPHNVLARLQAVMVQQQAPPPPAPAPAKEWEQKTGHQATNIGLYKQEQFVGKRVRAGWTGEAEGGYLTGVGDIAKGSCPPPAPSLARQPERQPTTIGLGGNVATTKKGMELQERYPAKEAERRYVGYAPIY